VDFRINRPTNSEECFRLEASCWPAELYWVAASWQAVSPAPVELPVASLAE